MITLYDYNNDEIDKFPIIFLIILKLIKDFYPFLIVKLFNLIFKLKNSNFIANCSDLQKLLPLNMSFEAIKICNILPNFPSKTLLYFINFMTNKKKFV